VFWQSLFHLAEHSLTHTNQVVFPFFKLRNIDYWAQRYFNTGKLTFEELSEDLLFDSEARSTLIQVMTCGEELIGNLLQNNGKRLIQGMRQAETQFLSLAAILRDNK
jgi:hypothetical protein